MKNIKEILSVVAVFILIVIIFISAILFDNLQWNNGSCKCGGNWEFSNGSRENNVNHYYYHCDKCGDVIKLNHTPSK